VGRRIRETRRLDMTQAEFAARIGLSQNYLSTMERAKAEIGAEISREFAKSVEWLLTREGYVPHQFISNAAFLGICCQI
jgi:transcriptional regulator with XRE-family HTH domain